MKSHPFNSEVDHIIVCITYSMAGVSPPHLCGTEPVHVTGAAVGCRTPYLSKGSSKSELL